MKVPLSIEKEVKQVNIILKKNRKRRKLYENCFEKVKLWKPYMMFSLYHWLNLVSY